MYLSKLKDFIKGQILLNGDSALVEQKFKMGFGWNANVDIDILALLINDNGKLVSDNHLVFYNSELRLKVKDPGWDNELAQPIEIFHDTLLSDVQSSSRPTDPEMSVIGSIEYRRCPIPFEEAPDDETWDIDLSKTHQDVKQIIFCANIYNGQYRQQNFKHVTDFFARLYYSHHNKLETEYLYELNHNNHYNTIVEICRLFKDKNCWKIAPIGIGHSDISDMLNKYTGF